MAIEKEPNTGITVGRTSEGEILPPTPPTRLENETAEAYQARYQTWREMLRKEGETDAEFAERVKVATAPEKEKDRPIFRTGRSIGAMVKDAEPIFVGFTPKQATISAVTREVRTKLGDAFDFRDAKGVLVDAPEALVNALALQFGKMKTKEDPKDKRKRR